MTTETIRRASRRDRWVVVDRVTVEDERLSFRARGLLVYLLSRPDNWRTRADQLARVAPEGRTAVLTAMKELREAGYLRTRRWQGEGGRWESETVVYERADAPDEDTPDTGVGLPDPGSPDVGSSDVGQPDPVTSTEGTSTDNEGSRTSTSDAVAPDTTTDPSELFSAEVVELTRSFAEGVLANGHTVPRKGTKAHREWYRTFDLLLRLGPVGDSGGAPPPEPGEVATVIAYVRSDIRDGPGFPGWGAVVRSPAKFREKYTQLRLEARRRSNGNGRVAPGETLAPQYEAAAQALRDRSRS